MKCNAIEGLSLVMQMSNKYPYTMRLFHHSIEMPVYIVLTGDLLLKTPKTMVVYPGPLYLGPRLSSKGSCAGLPIALSQSRKNFS